MVEVIEAYRDYKPPCKVRHTVEQLLKAVPQEQLAGLWRVVLTNAASLTGERKRGWSWHRGKKLRHQDGAAGMYHHEHRGDPAWIELFVDKSLGTTPPWLLKFRLPRGILLGGVLFHEVGHHIHSRHAPEHREREDVADEWGRRLARRYASRRHPLATLLLQPVAWLGRLFVRRRRSR